MPAALGVVVGRVLRNWESRMDSKDPNSSSPAFTRRSEKESICLSCFRTVQADRYTSLETAEEIHADVCLMKPGSPVRYALL